MDYFWRYPEICKLASTTSPATIQAMKAIFSRHGIPHTLCSGNGLQFDSAEFRSFSDRYSFTHTTSSPHYPQSNGFIERGVKTVKKLLRTSDDPYLAILNYRATPLHWCGQSPIELLMGRKVRTTLPQTAPQFIPDKQFLKEFRKSDNKYEEQQKKNYDKQHRVRP